MKGKGKLLSDLLSRIPDDQDLQPRAAQTDTSGFFNMEASMTASWGNIYPIFFTKYINPHPENLLFTR